MLYDRLAAGLPNEPLENAVIVSIDPSKTNREDLLATYGQILTALNQARVKRIIMAEPPDVADNESLPGWTAAMNASVPVYVPTRHRFADLATRDGFGKFA